MQHRIGAGDDVAAAFGRPPGPCRHHPARLLDHRDQPDDVVGLQACVDGYVGVASRDELGDVFAV